MLLWLPLAGLYQNLILSFEASCWFAVFVFLPWLIFSVPFLPVLIFLLEFLSCLVCFTPAVFSALFVTKCLEWAPGVTRFVCYCFVGLFGVFIDIIYLQLT